MRQLHIDDREFVQLSRALDRLPGEIKAKVLARALRRVEDMARTQVVRKAAQQSEMPVGEVRRRTMIVNGGSRSTEIVMRSGWWPLHKMGGAKQTRTGVAVRKWGHHSGTFIAGMRSGHTGVFVRTERSRLPIRELWGPNPASFVDRHSDEYEALLADVQARHTVPRVMHELNYILGRLGRR